MTSPFPGMDPYLEDPAFWPDFHHRFLDDWCDALAGQLPDNYEARLDESVNLVQMSPEVIKLIYPDIAVTKAPRHSRSKPKAGGTLLLDPVTIPHEFLEEKPQARIEVLHRPDRRVIAILEMLSPFNKTGSGYDQYKAKRNTTLGQDVHLVELDLLVGGDRPSLRYELPAGDYFVYISRADRRFDCEVYAWTVRDKLPTIPVPLKSPDADIHIDLGKVFRTTYKRGRYARSLSYGKPPVMHLSAADAAWVKRTSMAK
jgi:Protein of unknown function (DUF4058)